MDKKKKSQKKTRQPPSLIKHKPPRRSIFSFCSNKPSKPINSVIFHVAAVSILNETRFQTCFLSPFRSRSMIRIKEAITFMKRSFQSMSAPRSSPRPPPRLSAAPHNSPPLHGSPPNLRRQMTFLPLPSLPANFCRCQFEAALLLPDSLLMFHSSRYDGD